MRLLVEISQGLGNCIQGTPLVHALWLMGHEIDLFVNRDPKDAQAAAPLWQGWPLVGRVFTHREQFKVSDYDFGLTCYGRRLMQRLFAPGQALCVMQSAVRRQSESEANVELARFLGYSGDTPKSFIQRSERRFELPPKSVTIHAGCSPWALEKRWPHWAEICARLKSEGFHVVIVGTESDRSAERWEDAYDCRFNLPLLDIAALLDEATAHFGNDSGVGHLAAARGLPGLVLFGPTNPVKNAPNSRVLRALAALRLQGEEHEQEAERPVPIARLTVEEVWAAARAVLEDPRRDPERQLPPRVADSPPERWQQYIRMTQAQREADGITEIANLPPGFTPSISVVIPAYNRKEAALRAVNSVLAQSEKNVEVLLVDDGSTDGTKEAFAQPPERVRYLLKPNGGASSARNVGLRRARGEWIALLDSDDEWLPGKLERQLALGGDARASRHVHVNTDGSRQDKPEDLPGRDIFGDLYWKLSLKTSTLIFRRELLDKAGLFNERFPISNDWDFFLRLARAAQRFEVAPEPLAVIHRSDNSISRGNRYHALEHAYTRICTLNALLWGSELVSPKAMIRRAGAKQLELSRAKLAEGGKKARHKAKAHARDAMRAGFWLQGVLRYLRALL